MVMQTFPYGRLKIKWSAGAAASGSLVFRPDDGFQWLVLDAWGYHDDTLSVALAWQYYDGTTVITKAPSTALAANVNWELSRNAIAASSLFNPLLLSREVYAILVGTVGAGKKLYISALVLEFAG